MKTAMRLGAQPDPPHRADAHLHVQRTQTRGVPVQDLEVLESTFTENWNIKIAKKDPSQQ
jgi:hypothetical protein